MLLTRLRVFRDTLLDTLWFVPLLIVIGSLGLAVVMVEISRHVDTDVLAQWSYLFGASAGSSRSILSSVASGMITVAGLTFSLVMIAVTQASSQFTPRILRNFMSDRANQVVLGSFVGIFAYCLVVLRSIRSPDEGVTFVPSLGVVLGIVLAIVGIGELIYFVHHIATNLQATSIIARVSRETVGAIDRLFPDPLGEEASEAAEARTWDAEDRAVWVPVLALSTGFVQSVAEDRLIELAVEHDVVVRLESGIGDFVVADTAIASVATHEVAIADPERGADAPDDAEPKGAGKPAAHVDETTLARVAGMVVIGENRTVHQDASFGVRQLVDVALKALSPGVNDSTTAVTCISHLGAILVRLGGRRIESPVRVADGKVRVIASGPTYQSLVSLACDEIRQSAEGSASVIGHLIAMLHGVAEHTPNAHRQEILAEQVKLLREVAGRTVDAPYERKRLREAARLALDTIYDEVDAAEDRDDEQDDEQEAQRKRRRDAEGSPRESQRRRVAHS